MRTPGTGRGVGPFGKHLSAIMLTQAALGIKFQKKRLRWQLFLKNFYRRSEPGNYLGVGFNPNGLYQRATPASLRIITIGPEEVPVCDQDGFLSVPGLKAQVVDTTGSGHAA